MKNMEWIDIRDKLPKEEQEILMYKSGGMAICDYNSRVWKALQPTHWMPLPEPPK